MSLSVQNMRLRWAGSARDLVSGLSFSVGPGQIVSLVGPSGVGKSTLLDVIGGHVDAQLVVDGQVTLDGVDVTHVPAHQRRIGVLFQQAMLLPHLTVGGNVAFGLTATIRGRRARRAAVNTALESVGMAGFERRDPATLSGGQRARVALLRALLAEPRAILMDEPFSALDPDLRADMRGLVFDRIRAQAIPALLVTHDADDAAAAGGPVIRLR